MLEWLHEAALREFMAGDQPANPTDWIVARGYIEERERKKKAEEAGPHGPH